VISQFKNRFWKCSAGAVAVTTALVLPVLIGFASLGTEVGHWYLGQREMQGAADAAALSAAAEYICHYNDNGCDTGYQTVGVNYVSLNGFTIPTENVCFWTSSATNCGSQQISFIPTCPTSTATITYVCVAAEITQNTANWLTTRESAEPGWTSPTWAGHIIKPIPTPTLMARSVVAIAITTTPGHAGNGCLLALEPSGVGINFNGGGSGGGFTGTNCTLASDSKPVSLAAPSSSNSVVNAYAAILDGTASAGLSCPKGNCTFSNGVTYNTITPDPYSGRTYGTAPSVPAAESATLSLSGTTVTVTLPSAAPYLFKNELVTISGKKSMLTVPIASVISPTKFTYTASSLPTGSITFDPCGVSFTSGAINSGGQDSQHMQCYSGTTTSGNTTFKQFTIFSQGLSIGGTTVFDGTPTAPAVYAFSGGLTLGGTNTLGAGIYYVANGLTASTGVVSCGVAADTANTTGTPAATAACTLNNNAYGGITFALTSGAFQGAANGIVLDWTALCTDQAGGVVGCDTQSNPVLDATGTAIDTSGIALFASRSGGVTTKLSGQLNFWLNGTMYFPDEVWSQSGQVTFNQTVCSAIIAQEIDMSGNANMTNGCLTGIGSSPSLTSASWPPVLSQ
jgi:Flp pilus assembly protein TadG